MEQMWKSAFLFLTVLLAVGFSTRDPNGGVDANDPDVQKALQVAMEEYNKKSTDMYLFKVVKINRIVKEMWDGYTYTMDVVIARTVCRRGSMAQSCPVFINPHQAKVVIILIKKMY
uniref:Cystatin domain-containing protein n=1 Tax=Oryzias melastigma TaxID=30732 RepID=A0A3B3DYA8_ORYME